jgi:2-polyprenyl-3-methyl-5-hydroxy-6-metoxy-1,4-benzoquinol methylase
LVGRSKKCNETVEMNIQKIHKNWTELGEGDPLWVVLTDPTKRGNKWDVDEFLDTGRQEIAQLMRKLDTLGIATSKERALDFGCGVGRLSQALAAHWTKVDGVDVSTSMIERAKSINRFSDRVSFHVNVSEDLSAFPDATYDFIYSNIALQHIPPQFQLQYVADFVRLLKHNTGIAVFQTVHTVGWRKYLPNTLVDLYRRVRARGKAFIPLYGVSPDEVVARIQRRGGKVLHHETEPYGEWERRYINHFFFVSRP